MSELLLRGFQLENPLHGFLWSKGHVIGCSTRWHLPANFIGPERSRPSLTARNEFGKQDLVVFTGDIYTLDEWLNLFVNNLPGERWSHRMLNFIPARKLRRGEGAASSLTTGLTHSPVHPGLFPLISRTGTPPPSTPHPHLPPSLRSPP